MQNLLTNLKIILFKYLFSENEKCLLNQALNLQKLELHKDNINGLTCDFKQDVKDLDTLLLMCKNKLWD